MSRPLSAPVHATLLDAADSLLYREGVVSTGVDALCQAAGVGKPALYRHFGSKDGLVIAYLARRHEVRREALKDALARAGHRPRRRVEAIVDWLCRWMISDGFRGCGFLRALAETSSDVEAIVEQTRLHKAWMQSLLLRECAPLFAEPEPVARHLFLLIEGAVATEAHERSGRVAADLRALTTSILDGADRSGLSS